MDLRAKEILAGLMEGNRRYAEGRPLNPRRGADRRREVAPEQRPVAAVVCCSDSRVPPEIVFDQGIGDLFVVRVAGNVMSDVNIGSIEYAAEHLKFPLVMVLGHSRCGAVTAAVKGGGAPGRVASIVEALRPAVEEAKRGGGADVVEAAARINVERVVGSLRSAGPILSGLVKDGTISVVGAYYDLDTGMVEITVQ